MKNNQPDLLARVTNKAFECIRQDNRERVHASFQFCNKAHTHTILLGLLTFKL